MSEINKTTTNNKSEKETKSEKEDPLIALQDDDTFEDFPVEDWDESETVYKAVGENSEKLESWEDTENDAEPFSQKLKAELLRNKS